MAWSGGFVRLTTLNVSPVNVVAKRARSAENGTPLKTTLRTAKLTAQLAISNGVNPKIRADSSKVLAIGFDKAITSSNPPEEALD